MLNLLINFIFKTITGLFNLILSPFIAGITALFPSVNTYFNYISSFLNIALTYSTSALHLCLIPIGAITLLFDYLLIKYSIYLISIGIKFAMKVYTTLKP